MSVVARLLLFALVLGGLFLTGFGVGRAVGPLDDGPGPAPTEQPTNGHQMSEPS